MSGYDERLLAAAPALTREEKQAGYDIHLLANDSIIPSSSPRPRALPSNHGHVAVTMPSKEVLEAYSPRHTPWWRTKKWVLVFAILAVVAIGAIVGGVVGGTAGHHSKSSHNVTGIAGAANATDTSRSASTPSQSISSLFQSSPTFSQPISTTPQFVSIPSQSTSIFSQVTSPSPQFASTPSQTLATNTTSGVQNLAPTSASNSSQTAPSSAEGNQGAGTNATSAQ